MRKCALEGCENILQVTDSRTKFCSRRCAAINNKAFTRKGLVGANKGVPSTLRNPDNYCPKCGKRKSKSVDICRKCTLASRTIYDVLNKKEERTSHKYAGVRHDARNVLERSGVLKRCKLCSNDEFKQVLEVCHIKGVTEFSTDQLLNEVNSLSNLVYLYPSHHRLLDKGLISLEDSSGNK